MGHHVPTVINARLGRVRRELLNDRAYLVAPFVSIVPGVLNGSKGGLYYPPSEVAANPGVWNNTPLTLGHPTDPLTGQPTSARQPHVLNRVQLGAVYGDRVTENGERAGEAWFDVELTMRRAPAVHNALDRAARGSHLPPLELSTGLYTDNVPAANGSADDRGRAYEAIAINYRPDHLAILLDQRGACSVEDGCGVALNAAGAQQIPAPAKAPAPPEPAKSVSGVPAAISPSTPAAPGQSPTDGKPTKNEDGCDAGVQSSQIKVNDCGFAHPTDNAVAQNRHQEHGQFLPKGANVSVKQVQAAAERGWGHVKGEEVPDAADPDRDGMNRGRPKEFNGSFSNPEDPTAEREARESVRVVGNSHLFGPEKGDEGRPPWERDEDEATDNAFPPGGFPPKAPAAGPPEKKAPPPFGGPPKAEPQEPERKPAPPAGPPGGPPKGPSVAPGAAQGPPQAAPPEPRKIAPRPGYGPPPGGGGGPPGGGKPAFNEGEEAAGGFAPTGTGLAGSPISFGPTAPPAANLRLSHDQIRNELETALKGRFTQDRPAPALVEVQGDHAVYTDGQKHYKQTYRPTQNGDGIELTGEPVAVKQVTRYEPVGGAPAPGPAPQGGGGFAATTNVRRVPMTLTDKQRREAVGYLTVNCDCWKGGEATLNNKQVITDDQLVRLVKNARKQKQDEVVANAARTGVRLGEGVLVFNAEGRAVLNEKAEGSHADVGGSGGTATEANKSKLFQEEVDSSVEAGHDVGKGVHTGALPGATNNARTTVKQYLSRADVPDEVKEVVANGLEAIEAQKRQLADRLVANLAKDDPDRRVLHAEYMAKRLPDLKRLIKAHGGYAPPAPAVNALRAEPVYGAVPSFLDGPTDNAADEADVLPTANMWAGDDEDDRGGRRRRA